LRQRKVARLPYDSEHGKLWQDIKADLDKTRARASKFAHDAEWALGKKTARVLGVVMLFAVVVALLVAFLNGYVAPTKPSEKKDLVLAMAQILAGTALLSGLYFTWRTLQVNREGQITERFTRAIEQLGASEGDEKCLEIRIGGIFALERLANESKEDYGAIMEVLTAYVRRQARRNRQEVLSEQVVLGKFPSAPLPSADIQAILTVIGRRARTDEIEQQGILDLHDMDLYGAIRRGARTDEIEQQGILDLHDTDLHGAQTTGAHLGRRSGANLRHCVLVGADLRGAFLYGADFYGAYLTKADFSGAILSSADLSGAVLYGADLYGADLRGANLWGANLTQAQLEKTTGDENTQLPSDLEPPAHWGVKPDEQPEADE